MSRRDQIKMTPEEVDAFLQEQRTMLIATIGKDGRPHLIAMWYAFLEGVRGFWTFAKSQTVVNVRRDPLLGKQMGRFPCRSRCDQAISA